MPNAVLLSAARPAAMLHRLAGVSPPSLLVAALLIVVLHGVYALWTGLIMTPDSGIYSYWSGRLVDSGFSYGPILSEVDSEFPAILYVLFGTLLALLRLAFGDGWSAALVVLNFTAHVALGLLLVRLAVRVTGSGVGGWTALLLFLGCYDLLQWVNVVSSDATFVLIAFGIFALAGRRILGDARNWLTVFAPAAAGIIYRPTGIVLVPDLLWALYLSRKARPPAPRALVLAILAAGATAGLLLFAWFMQDSTRWPFATLSGPFRVVAESYAAGEVVSGRPETFHAPPSTLLDFVLISLDRFLHFFAIGAEGYGQAHWLLSGAFLLPCYALGGWLLLALAHGVTAFEPSARKLFLVAAGAVLAYASFHALIQVDFDWRYRTPILPHLILLAAGGAADLLRRAARQ